MLIIGVAAKQARSRAVEAAAGDHLATSVAMVSLALVSELRGDLGDALQIIDDAVRLADDGPGRLGHRYPIHRFPADILTALGRLDEASATIETGMRISEELGVTWAIALYQLARALERFLAGHWDDAVAEIEPDTGLAGVPGGSYNLYLRGGVLCMIRLHRNDLPGAWDAVVAAPGELPGAGLGYRAEWFAWARALLLEASGDLAQALETLSGCWDRCARSGLGLEFPVIGPDLVRLALAAGDVGRARDVAAAVTAVASHNEVPWITGAALRCQGLAEDDAELLDAAVSAYDGGSRPLELALTCEDAGAAVARRGNEARAGRLLDQAITIYERLDSARPRPGRGHAAADGYPPRPPCNAPPRPERLAEPDPQRAGRGGPGCRGTVQPPDRPAAVRLTPDRANPPRARVRQAAHHLPRSAGRRGSPAPGASRGTGMVEAGTARRAPEPARASDRSRRANSVRRPATWRGRPQRRYSIARPNSGALARVPGDGVQVAVACGRMPVKSQAASHSVIEKLWENAHRAASGRLRGRDDAVHDGRRSG